MFAVLPAQVAQARQDVSTDVELVIDGVEAEWPNAVPRPGQHLQWEELLVAHFHTLARFQARVDSINGQGLVFVSQGDVTRIASSRLHHDGMPTASEMADRLNTALETAEGQPATASVLEGVAQNALRVLSDAGFVGSHLAVASMVPTSEGGELAVEWSLELGKSFSVAGIVLDGESRTNERLLWLLLDADPGVSVREFDIDEVQPALEASGLFASVGSPSWRIRTDSTAILFVPVVARAPGAFDMALGVLPGGDSGGAQLVGQGFLRLDNAFGNGRLVEASIDRLPGLSSRVELTAEDPFVAGLPFRARLGFQGYQEDSTFSDVRFNASALLRLDRSAEIGFRLSRERTRPGQAGAFVVNGLQLVPEATTNLIGLEFRYSRLDRPTLPRRGVAVESLLESGRRSSSRLTVVAGDTASVSRSTELERLEVGLRGFGEVTNRFTWAMGFDAFVIRGQDLDPSQLGRMGGATSLRGYDEDRLRGETLLRGFIEPRWWVDASSYVFGFVDLGLVGSDSSTLISGGSESQQTNWYPGFGIGMLLDTATGPITVSYAVNTEESITRGRIHVAFSFTL